MCGFLVHFGAGDNRMIRHRGPDATTTKKPFGCLEFVHNLLSVTGEFHPQPFVKGNLVAVYNGQIYNRPFERSDGEVIIPLYEEYGEEFPKFLDGEFAVALYDFDLGKALFITDRFGTKPLWVNGLECASYRSGVGGRKVPANRVIRMTFAGSSEEWNYHEWDWGNQHKDSYDDWIAAFERAVERRGKDRCFMGLSSGYDSGAIACELKRQGFDFAAYAIYGTETRTVIDARLREIPGRVIEVNKAKVAAHIAAKVEPYHQQIRRWRPHRVQGYEILNDKAIYGLGAICELGIRENRRVYLSGQGADEILCDYSKFSGNGELLKFPTRLYEWANFAGNKQEAYLMKEEHIAGSYGIETRYPYLDTELVQEFLWLSCELKNRIYKAPLHEYLTRNKVPFDPDCKIGFNPI